MSQKHEATMINLLKNINWNGKTFGYDLLMINDRERNQFYEKSLQGVAGKIVLDIGAGTGLLSVMAVQSGAKLVYAFEYDPQNYAVTKQFIQQAGLSDKIILICADVLSVDKYSWDHQPIDVIITETFANDCFIENFAFLVDHVEKNFNLSADRRWIPDQIDLSVGLVNVEPKQEFDPGVDLPQTFISQINNAVDVYKNNFYHKHSQVNLPVALIPKTVPYQSIHLDTFNVDVNLKSNIDLARYYIRPNFHNMNNPYLKVDWIFHGLDHVLYLNNCVSWKSIAFLIDRQKEDEIYLRFHPLTHALLASQQWLKN